MSYGLSSVRILGKINHVVSVNKGIDCRWDVLHDIHSTMVITMLHMHSHVELYNNRNQTVTINPPEWFMQGSFCVCNQPVRDDVCNNIVTSSLTGWAHTQNGIWFMYKRLVLLLFFLQLKIFIYCRGPFGNKSTVFQIMAWHWTGTKSLPATVLTKISNIIKIH